MDSRRDFLKRLAATAAALSLDPFRGIETIGDTYRNARLGLQLVKPPGWEFSSLADFAALRERQVLEDLTASEAQELGSMDGLPVFVFEDPTNREGTFSPEIILYDDLLEIFVPDDDPVSAHVWALGAFDEALRDLRVFRSPDRVSLRGAQAARAEWSYVHQTEGGQELEVRMVSLIVLRGERVHTFYLSDSNISPRVPATVWKDVIESIAYDPV